MAAMKFLIVLCLLALVQTVVSKTIVLKWTRGKMSASGGRLDHKNRALYVKSGDKVHFKWNGEQMGLYGFYKESDYKKCAKGNLNYMKNTRGSGLFSTKANRSGWRYYAHISGAQDGACKYERKGCHKGVKGTCQAKVKIHWG